MAVVAVVAVLAGLLLPQLMPGETVVEAAKKAETALDTKAEYKPPTRPNMPSAQGMLARLAWGTALVLALAAASLYGMRRYLRAHEPALAGARELRLMETLPLGNRCALHLVHLGKREVLVGVDGTGIKTIVPLAKEFEEVLEERS